MHSSGSNLFIYLGQLIMFFLDNELLPFLPEEDLCYFAHVFVWLLSDDPPHPFTTSQRRFNMSKESCGTLNSRPPSFELTMFFFSIRCVERSFIGCTEGTS